MNKDFKGKQDYVYLFEEVFVKVKDRDLRNFEMMEKEKNFVNLEFIYNIYVQLNNCQEKIRFILFFQLLKQGKNV